MEAPATSNRHEFSWRFYFLLQLILTLGLTTNSKTYRPAYFFALTALACYLSWFTTSGNEVNDYAMGCQLFTVIFMAFDYLVVTDVHREVRVLEGPLAGKNIEESSFWTRLRWALTLEGSVRGLGWSFAAKEPSIAPAPPRGMSRRVFILSKLREIAINLVLFDLNGFVNRANPCFSQHGCRVSQMSIAEDGLQVLVWRYAFLGYGVASFLTVGTLHSIYAVVSVGLGITEPWQWPPLFGSFREAFTVRRFWGRTWHQMMRRFLLSITSKAARRIGLPRGRRLTDLFQLFLAFFISGIIHYVGGDFMVFGKWRGGSMAFFCVQPVAIVVEEVVIWLSRSVGISRLVPTTLARLVGFLWVATWLAYTVTIMAEPHLDVGFFESGPSFSLILGMWKGDWSPKV